MSDELAIARLKRDRDRLANAERWTPQEALEAALADLKLGELYDIEAITVIVASSRQHEGQRTTIVERFTGSSGISGPKDTFWIIGMVQKAIIDWLT